MGKKSKNKQRGAALPTANNTQKITVPSPTLAPSRATAMVQTTPPVLVVDAPKRVVASPEPTVPDGLLKGVVIGSQFYKNGNPIFCKIRDEAGEVYTAHHSASQVPPNGSIVTFTPSTFEGKNHVTVKSAVVDKVLGIDTLVQERVKFIENLSTYVIMRPQDYYGMDGAEVEIADIVGKTPSGELIFYYKE